MVQFFDQILLGNAPSINIGASKQNLQGLLDAMVLEGYEQLKPPCYNIALINPVNPTCAHGAPWHNQYSQPIMGGTLPGSGSKIVNDDNFHRVYSVHPVHLSEIDSDCDKTSTACVMKTITVSENIYEIKDKIDTGFYPIAATEMKAKLSSRQKV
jgi:hypothetical protein